MITRRLCLSLLTSGITLATLAQASPGFAVFPYYDWRTRSWQRSGVVPVAVAPVAVAAPPVASPCDPCAAPACSPCATTCSPCPTTVCSPVTCNPCTTCASPSVNYVAETSYRLQVVNRPVTTYQPIVTPGPCGTCVTSYMPVTTLVAQTQQVPVTTYRPVIACAPACCTPCATCPSDTCATGNCPSPGCPSGNCGVAPASGTSDDQRPRLDAAPIPAAPVAPAPPMEPSIQPEPATDASSGTPSLYGPGASTSRPLDTIPSSAPRETAPAPLKDLKQDGLKPVAPQLLDSNDKTARLIPGPAQPASRIASNSGWYAAD